METDTTQGQLILFEGTDEQVEDQVNVASDQRMLLTESSDQEINGLYTKWIGGRLILQPDFQRHFVWDRKKASRLVESVLLSVPLPIVYLAEEPNNKIIVIDGQQRLTSFFSFINGKLPDGAPFHLTGLEVFSELNGKAFNQLDQEYQERIKDHLIRVVTIKKSSDPNLKFEIFGRLNTGAMPLNDMELRNCIYQGDYMKLLKELAATPDFRFLLGITDEDARMKDVELVLRFTAFEHATYLRYAPPMKKFLNEDMKKYRNITDDEAEDLRKKFKNSVAIIKSMFGQQAFKRFVPGSQGLPDGAWEAKTFNASLYDVMMGVFCDKDRNQVQQVMDLLRESIIDLMTSNPDFIDSVLLATSNKAKVIKRFDLMRTLVDRILDRAPKQTRLFTLDLKRRLFAKNPVCAICNQQIQSLDDAAVDHIQQYWLGGLTDPENARLTHRFCNNARPRNG